MDPYISSSMEVSPTVAFMVSNFRPGFGLFCTWIFHCDETAVVGGMGDSVNRLHSYHALRNWSQIPGGPYTFSNGRITAAVRISNNPPTGVKPP